MKNVEDVYPLTPVQGGMLFHTLYEPGSGVYVENLGWTLKGALNISEFERAWQHVTDRHSILRTAFFSEGLEEPLQVVRRRVKLHIEYEDLRGLDAGQQQEHLDTYIHSERKRGFEMTKAPLIRLAILHWAEDTYRIVWSHHHMLLDGWSVALMLKEVFLLYEAYSKGKEFSLDQSPPYSHYIAWVQQQDKTSAEEFWAKRLKGFTAPTPVGIDRLKKDQYSGDGNFIEQELRLSADATGSLQALARQQKLTLNTIVQGAWALLLSRYSGQQDIVFGIIVSNRPAELAGVESMVGLFLNALPVRVDVSAQAQLMPWLKQLQSNQFEARQYEYTSLAEIQRRSDVPRGVQLFDSTLAFENFPVDEALREQGGSLEVTDFMRYSSKSNYPVNLIAHPGTELTLQISYDPSRFDGSSIDRLLVHLKTLLEEMSANPDRRLSELSLLTEAERQQLLIDWNTTDRRFPEDKSLHQLFEQQVDRTPDRIALVFDSMQLTYRELNARANQLAHYLQTMGIGPEVPVGVCMGRTEQMIVALLGVLKAGGAYVPIDPDYPLDRITFMLEDSRLPVLLTTEEVVDRLPSSWVQVIDLDSDWEMISSQSVKNPISPVLPENLAYVIYTSGTTGRPKGVMVQHSGVCNLAFAQQEAFRIDAESCVLQFASLSFDASVSEVFTALLTGAKLCLGKKESLMPGPELLDLLRSQSVSVVTLPPSALMVMPVEPLPALRTLVTAGEACNADLIARWLDGHRILNAYGPTETTVCATIAQLFDAEEKPTIGNPIANTRVYVVSENKEPVPVGVSGELYIGGAGVARGYFGRPDLTAERFVPDPFSKQGGQMLYRTGDQCRYREDGRIDYQGRIDNQVKIRGYRIEPGEIEAVMTKQAGVREAAVAAARQEGAGARLVAYYAEEEGHRVGVEQIREYLGSRLPDYMVPGVYVRVERMPLTPNGKIDRRALPEVGEGRPELEQKYVAARSGNEEVLAGIWRGVLGLERVGVEDSFFVLGGDSIRSVAVVSKAQEAGLRISLAEIFEHRTIRKIVEQMGGAERKEERNRSEAMSLISESDRRKMGEQRIIEELEDAYPMTKMQAGMIYHSQYRAETAIYHSIIKVELSGKLDVEAMREAIRRLVKRHGSLRTTFDLTSYSEPMQMVWREMEAPLEVEDIRGLSEQEQERRVEEWVEEEKGRGFELKRGPLVRFQVQMRGEERFEFGFSAHHAIIDGWSDAVVFAEMQSDYEAMMRGEELPEREELRTSFREYVAEEIEELTREESREYWREKMRERVVTKLPKKEEEREGEEGGREEFGMVRVEISGEVSKRLQKVAQGAGVPIKSVLLGAHLRVMSVIGGQEEVMTGVVTSGRLEERDGEKVVGLFVNTLPYGKKMRGGKWVELAREVFEEEKEMMKYRRYPLAEIKRQEGGGELFETCFNYVHLHGNGEVAGGGELEVKRARYVTETNLGMMAHFSMDPYEMKLGLELDYDGRQMSRKQAERIGGYYERTLEEMAREEEGRYEKHWPMSVEERREIVEEWNETEVKREGRERSIEEMIERVAEEKGERIAVVGEGEGGELIEISYRELNRRATKVGNYLRKKGVRAEEVVGVMVERGVEIVVGMLGVMKAGGGYVPLDGEYPRQRVEQMVKDSRAKIVIVGGGEGKRKMEGWGMEVEVVDLEKEREEIEKESERREGEEVEGENVAYVIYTSGSTGTPKGVQISHSALVNFIHSMMREPGLQQDDVLLSVTSISFDIAALEIFLPLATGARLVIASRETALDGKRLAALIDQEMVTVLQATPSGWQSLLMSGWTGSNQLKALCGGEELKPDLAQNLLSRSRQTWNMYGPTETTIWSTLCALEADGQVLIGHPIANTRVYVVSENKEPVPVGVSGELLIGGAGVSRGYFGRPDLTAERFVPDPFSKQGGQTLYRTGDRCRYQEDGRIDYQGRIDNQVKIRGYRIEPGEIEAVMTKQAGVREAAVAAARQEGAGARLVAYYVEEEGHRVGVEQIREYLGSRLPDYMVPGVYVRVERMPLTPNGKIDRRALPEVGEGRPELEQKYVAARSGNEEVLAGIWRGVLGLERVGVEDSFFVLGGDSIRSVAVVSKAQEAGLRISLAEIFEHRTIRKIVEQMGGAERKEERNRSEAMSLISESDRRKMGEQRIIEELEDAYPMTKMQAGMIYHSQYRAETAIYHSIIKVELSGKLDVEAMREAIRRLVKRHGSLRTTFDLTSYSEPMQMVWREMEAPLEVEDIRGLSEQEQERRVEEWVEEEKGRGFELKRGPLVRFQVQVRGEERFEFGFSAHHAIIDGWSDAVVFAEMQSDYEAMMRGEELPEREELRTSFREYVAEEIEELKREESRAYWREKMRERVVTKLPKKEEEREGEEGGREEFGMVRVEISGEVSKRLQKVAQGAGVPIKSVLLGAHLRVMSVIGGQEEVMTGVVTSGRLEERDGEKVVGLFVNTLPYGKKMRGGKWVELAREVFEEEKEMMKYRRYPLAEIKRQEGGGELFETCFNYVHLHGNGEVAGGGELEVKRARYVTETNLGMMAHFSMDPYEMKLGLELDYDGRQMSRKQAERIGGYYERTLEEMAREEEGRYEKHWPMSVEERREIVEEWNETEVKREGRERSIEEMIERVAEEKGERIAVVGEGEGGELIEISYRELNRRATKVGNYLRKKGVRAEEVVGVMVERGVEMVVGMLGVMKAGGGYVPLDGEYPRQRVEQMVKDSRAKIVIVGGGGEGKRKMEGWGMEVEVVDLEKEREEIEKQSERREGEEVEGENVAYVIYTSGSTGIPKGVAIERRSTVELIRWAAETFSEDELSGVLASTSICFDLSVFEIFVPLCCGGKVIVARNALDLIVDSKREGVTLINTVPSAMAELVRAKAIPATVKTVNLAGEALPKALVDAVYNNDWVERVYNLYGPTEDTTYSTFALMNRNCGQTDSTVSIGRPVTNSQVYILNERLQPVPVGVVGSLFIGGNGLARGYLNRPEMTAERFTPNPFAAQPGGRMYTTGDLARYDEKGEIEFLGRKDHQVKIRGFRIEMGEIESTLSEHTSVRAVTVLAREDVPGETYLAAYIVPNTSSLPSAAELRAFLKERVPDHMVPSAMIFLEEFPLTPNGKVDRRALPAPDKSRTDEMPEYVAPRTAMEEVIAEIWAELLRVERVGIQDNFFELGGHSLMVTQVLSRVRAIFDVELPLSELVESPTVAGLAEAIEAALRSEEGLGASPF